MTAGAPVADRCVTSPAAAFCLFGPEVFLCSGYELILPISVSHRAYSDFSACTTLSSIPVQHNVGEGEDFTITEGTLIPSPPGTDCLPSPMLKIEATPSSFVSLLPAL